jgi:Glutathione S-transferase, N-terminal domain
MKLYVCWGTMELPWGHPCHRAHEALHQAGWDPDVQRTYGWAALGDTLNPTRKPVRELTGQSWVPVLVTDDDQVIQGSQQIVDWAQANPAAATPAS